MTTGAEPTVTEILDRAEGLARQRGEALSGVHLLAALGATAGSTRDLLEERSAGFRRVLDQWERLLDRGPAENLQLLLRSTQALARRYGGRSATSPHLLLALLVDGQSPVRRVLDGLSVDVTGLRNAAQQLAQGLPTRRRTGAPEGGDVLLPRGTPLLRGTPVPVMPLVPVSGPRAGQDSRASATPARGVGQAVPLVPAAVQKSVIGRRRRPESQLEGLSRSLEGPLSSEALPFVQMADGARPGSVPPEAAGTGGVYDDLTLDPKVFPILGGLGRNLSLLSAQGKLDDVIGREEEIEHALDVLAKRHGNSPCLIGPAGVGKTTVARGIAARLAERDPDEGPRIVIEIPIGDMVAGTGVRGALAGRLAALKKEVRAAGGRVVLFFDEIHQLFSGEHAEEIASDLKLSLARGELPCMGATSVEEFRRVIEADAALSRRFTAVEIEEPSREDAFLVLSSVAERLSRHHHVAYEEEALTLAIQWAVRYLPGRALPDKVVSIADLAGARARRRQKTVVDHEAMAEVVAHEASMPVERLLESDAERMLALEDILSERVIGHSDEIRKIARILRRNAAGLGSRRPIGTFLLLGPTGVGKTETAKAIAEVLFHSDTAMTRLDMAEMSEAHAVARLVGAPPGYIGHDAGGQLTEAVRRRPYQVILLDEIEKAHPDVLTAFLAVLDEGRMTDSRGRLVDFTNTVILLTSNLGAAEFGSSRRKRVGFQAGAGAEERGHEAALSVVRQSLPPELYNRLDEVLTFSPLSRADVTLIGRKLLKRISDELELSRGVALEADELTIEYLLDAGGYDPELGARPLKRTIARLIEAPLAEALLSGELERGAAWSVTCRDGQLVAIATRRGASAAE